MVGPTALRIRDDARRTVEGPATDPEDGNLNASLLWTSSLDGALGGTGIVTPMLSAGVHIVTLSVTDSGGLSSSQSVTVTVS